MAEEWGPWIEHDGKCCPITGVFSQWQFDCDMWLPVGTVDRHGNRLIDPRTVEGRPYDAGSWRWCDGVVPIIRYRVRKPRGLKILQQIVADPQPLVETDDPAPVAAR